MTFIKKYLLPVIFVILTLIMLYIFRSVPVSNLWNGFSVLHVPVKTNSQVVIDTLESSGCKDTISFYNQQLPFINEFLPLQSEFQNSYLEKRNLYFFDKSKSVMIYYIPAKYSKNASNAVSTLINKYKIDAGLDCKTSFPFITPIICLAVALIFFFFAENKIVFGICSVFPIFFSFSMPFYINAAAICILIYGLYLAQKLWNRKGCTVFLLKNPLFDFVVLCSVLASFFCSVLSGIIFIMTLISSLALLFLYKELELKLASKKRFNPVLIRSAKNINFINVHSIKKIFISVGAIVFLTVLYFTSVNLFSLSNSQDLSFPMPVSYNNNSQIPSLNEYVEWTWNEITKPYKSIYDSSNSTPKLGDKISIKRFVDSKDGIKTNDEVLFCYNDDFKNNVINSIDELNYPALEKLMKSQKRDFFVDYSYVAGESFNFISLIMMLVMMLLPTIMATIYLNGIKKNDSI